MLVVYQNYNLTVSYLKSFDNNLIWIKMKLRDVIRLIFIYLIFLGVIALALLLIGVWKSIFLIIINLIFVIACFILGIGLFKLYNWARIGTIFLLFYLIVASLFLISFNSRYYFLSSLGAVVTFSIIPIIIIRYLLKHKKLEYNVTYNKTKELSKDEARMVSNLIFGIVIFFIGLTIMIVVGMHSENYNPRIMSIDLDTRTVSTSRRIAEEPTTFEECTSTKFGIVMHGYPEYCKYLNLTFINPEHINAPTVIEQKVCNNNDECVPQPSFCSSTETICINKKWVPFYNIKPSSSCLSYSNPFVATLENCVCLKNVCTNRKLIQS
jgi:hypothetical protein